ncbi:MAG: ROK family protein [Bdellovibrionales bacterium]|nr:ROK family protein [Bdellovibrionales bacterium]
MLPMLHHYLGIDIGGTKTEASVLTLKAPNSFEDFKVLFSKRVPTERNHGLESFLTGLKSVVEETLGHSKISLEALKGIGIGLPGSIHPGLQVMAQGSIPFLKDLDLRSEFRRAIPFDGPMVFENDANCFALAEANFGAGRQWSLKNKVSVSDLCMVGITLGTGVGGGIIMNGKLIRGRRGGAGEIGHMGLRPADRSCYCGKSGCAEQFLSGPGLEHSYRIRAHPETPVPGKQIFARSENNDPYARSAVEGYKQDLLHLLSNLSNVLDPHLMVLGGGISLEDQIYEGLETRLSEGCFLTSDPPAILKNSLGDAAGALGAAFLAFQSSRDPGSAP